MIDLRSDTVTRPTDRMKAAMLDAPLGDDVLGDDPSVIRLEAQIAERAGKETALFTPSGTMANLMAICLHTRPGDEVLLEAGAHPFNYEAAGAPMMAGVQFRPLDGDRGVLAPDVVRAAIRPPDDHFAPATLLTIEDTANRGGGTVHTLDRLDALTSLAHQHGLATHLDGARVFHAVRASGVPLARRLAGFDTASICFSKGLGAPVGSALVGSREALVRARRIRKALGGGMRQSGMLAAACSHALDHHVERLDQDHANATALLHGLTSLGLTTDPCPTNLLYVHVPDAPAMVAHLAAQDIAVLAVGPTTLRMVTHLDVDASAVPTVIEAVRTGL